MYTSNEKLADFMNLKIMALEHWPHELIHVRLIEVMRDSSYKHTILEQLHLTKTSLDTFIGFLQQLEVSD